MKIYILNLWEPGNLFMVQKSIAFFGDSNFWSKRIQDSGVIVIPTFRKIPLFFKPLRILHFRYNLPIKEIWFSNWKKRLQKFDLIILPASHFTPVVANFIDKLELKDNVRLIYWYWNPVRSKYSPDKISERWEKWSFDKKDAQRFHLKYASTYYFDSILIKEQELTFDVFFIGQDKGRLKELIALNENFKKLHVTSYFHIVSDSKLMRNKKIFKNKISYEKVLMMIGKARCILEMLQENQSGLTLRSMESIFLKKKLITNNKNISKYEFYCKENIFILGVDDLSHLSYFIASPYKELNNKILSQFTFQNWLKRLLDKTEIMDES